ncbi:MAG: hypothetical protein ACXW2L_19805 [Burkholderiales bacterium]
MATDLSNDIRTNEEEPGRVVPRFGAALAAVIAIVVITAVLSLLIYGIMIAVRSIEPRNVISEVVGKPVGDVVRSDYPIVSVTVL